MSGGSYEYLCHKDAEDLFQMEDQIESMAERLEGLGYAEDVAKETRAVLTKIVKFRDGMNPKLSKLHEVWRAVEWWDSGDSGEDALKWALGQYRGKNT